MSQNVNDKAKRFLEHADQLLCAAAPPELPDEFASDEEYHAFHEKMLALRSILSSFAKGDLSNTIKLRGFAGGSLKALQAHLCHLTWQVQQVEQGDFTQRVDFLGDFSKAFNSMIVQLDTTMKALKKKEEDLTKLAQTLQSEVELRSSAVYALRRSEAKFKYLAEHDSLTGAYNRRSFLSIALTEMEKAAQKQLPSCVAMLDVDKFKVLNDTYGHLIGDEALKFLVMQSSKCLRQADIMGRYGGEEFVFFFSGANLEQGVAAAERIRTSIAETPLEVDGKRIPVTVSIGVSTILPEWIGSNSDFLLQQILGQADVALYEAKENGRNRVCPAPVTQPQATRFH